MQKATLSLCLAIFATAAQAGEGSLPFKAAGKTFTANTGCSPHAPTFVVSVGTTTVTAEERHAEDGQVYTYTLELADNSIDASASNRFSGQTTSAVVRAGDADYAATVATLRGYVDEVLNGSVCVPGTPALQDVDAYLAKL